VLLEVEGHAAARLRVEELGALLRGPAGSVARVVVAKQPPPPRGAVPRLSSPPRLSSSAAALFSPPSSSAASASRPALLPMVPSVGAATANSKGAAAAAASPSSPPPTLALELERRPIPQPPVKTAPLRSPRGRSVAYIRLHYFARDATRALAGALLAAEARGDEGVVLDLRNNPGGVFEEALADAAMFLRRGEKIASTTRTPAASPTSPPPPPMATFVAGDLDGEASPSFLRRAALSSAPMAVLVDAGSASGAEVLAGALRDSGRAVLVGPRRTFGKGLIQYYFLVDDERGGDGSGGDRRKNSSNDSGVGGGIKVTGKKKETSFIFFFHLRPPPSLASSCSSSFHPLAERTKKNDPNTPFVSHLVAGYSTPKGHDPSAEKGLEPQRWCSGHGSGPPGSSSWASFSSSSSAAAAEVEGDGCLLEALRSVDDEIDRAGGADAAAELARF